jgi:hypothetical protein
MGIVETFLRNFDAAVETVTRWHNPSLGGGGLFHFNPAIETWLQMTHEERIAAIDRIRNRRIRGNQRQVDYRFFLALKEGNHDINRFKYYWKDSHQVRLLLVERNKYFNLLGKKRNSFTTIVVVIFNSYYYHDYHARTISS